MPKAGPVFVVSLLQAWPKSDNSRQYVPRFYAEKSAPFRWEGFQSRKRQKHTQTVSNNASQCSRDPKSCIKSQGYLCFVFNEYVTFRIQNKLYGAQFKIEVLYHLDNKDTFGLQHLLKIVLYSTIYKKTIFTCCLWEPGAPCNKPMGNQIILETMRYHI